MTGEYAQDYDRNFGFFKDYSREAVFLDGVFRRHGQGVARVLDIACGPGHHIVELARLGYRCGAADIDPDMLDMARAAAAGHGVALLTHRIDMRAFRLDAAYDAAVNMFYSFQNVLFAVDEQGGFLNGVAALLPVGGLFVIEIMPEENNLRLYPPGRSFPVHRSVEDDGTTVTVTSTSRILDETTKEIVFDYETVYPDGEVEHEELVSPVRRIRLAEFEGLIGSAGFRTTAAYGDCDVDVPFGDDSAKLVAVLERR